MYLTDTFEHSIFAFDFNVELGKISNQRTILDFSQDGKYPDGLRVDQARRIWVAFCSDPGLRHSIWRTTKSPI